jgi:catechol O-methyltransferase
MRAGLCPPQSDTPILSDRFRIGDGWCQHLLIRTLKREHKFVPGSLDLVFLDHDKSDLELIIDAGWLHPGSVVVADNIRVPGAPAYRAHMRENDGTLWRTTEHRTHAEYQSVIKDLVLESDYLGSQSSSTGASRTER